MVRDLKSVLDDYLDHTRRSSIQSTPLDLAESMIVARARRRLYLRPELFCEPDWDMLLDLYVATLKGQSVGVSSLSIAANVPGTTALRHISDMERHGEIIRVADPHDRRRWFLKLSPDTFDAITAWLSSTKL